MAAADYAARKVLAANVEVSLAAHRRADEVSLIAMADFTGENTWIGDDYGLSMEWMRATHQPGLEQGKDSSDESDDEVIFHAGRYLAEYEGVLAADGRKL